MSVWTALGIARTADPSAIRRAYADRLRALDPDSDPQGFADLRAARDEALWLARHDAADEEPRLADDPELLVEAERETDADEQELHEAFLPDDDYPYAADLDLPGGAPAGSPSATTSPWAPIDYDAHYRAVLELLFENADLALGPEREAELRRQADTLLADPRLDEIGFRADAEHWFAEVLADAGDRAEPILAPVVERFGWLADRGRIDQPWAMALAVERYEVRRLAHRFDEPAHKYHRAWRELTRPDGAPRPRLVRWREGANIRKLLAAIRSEHPELEQYLVPARVAEWEPKERGGGVLANLPLTGIWLGLILLVNLARLCAPAEPSQSIDARPGFEQVVTPVLRAVGGDALTLPVLEQRNRKLADLLRSNWNIAEEAGDPASKYVGEMDRLLSARFAAGLEEAGYDRIAAWRRVQLADAKIARARDAETCDRFFKEGALPSWLSGENWAARREMVGAVLLAYTGDPPPGDPTRRFTIPGPVIEKMLRRTRLGVDRLDAALLGDGAAADRCATRTALLEVALELPRKQALPLLRAM